MQSTTSCSNTCPAGEDKGDYYLHQFTTGCLSQFSYYIESEKEAAIIDPVRDSEMYLDLLEKRGATLKYVIETHFHADFVSGHVELMNLKNSTIVFGPKASPDYSAKIASDEELIPLGKINIKVLHTPGHTPESTSYLLLNSRNEPKEIFTGDCLFLGDVGRPDLAVSSDLTEKDLANMLYDSLKKLKSLPDDVIVYPGHGAGSACGKRIAAGSFDTLGNQKKTNYALNDNLSREEFVEIVTSGLCTPPQYFFMDAMINKKGYDSTRNIVKKSSTPINPEEFIKLFSSGDKSIVVIDTRDIPVAQKGFIKGSYIISLKIPFAIWCATLIKPEQKIILIADSGKEKEAIVRLARVGLENVIGFVEGGFEAVRDHCQKEGKDDYIVSLNPVKLDNVKETIDEFSKSKNVAFLDVREKGEWTSTGIIPNSNLTSLRELEEKIDEYVKIGTDKTIAVFCKTGGRAAIAASILKKYGIKNVCSIGGILNMLAANVEITTYKE